MEQTERFQRAIDVGKKATVTIGALNPIVTAVGNAIFAEHESPAEIVLVEKVQAERPVVEPRATDENLSSLSDHARVADRTCRQEAHALAGAFTTSACSSVSTSWTISTSAT